MKTTNEWHIADIWWDSGSTKALTSLKYFNENVHEYNIVCARSLLGVALHQGTSFPVGKVDFLKLYPLTFYEFLLAIGQGGLAEL